MTQTIKERLKLLKKRNPELNEYADNYAQHIYVRNKGFNEGVDACLPLLEDVEKDERERIYNEIYNSLPKGEVSSWDWVLWSKKMLQALTDPQ